MSSKQSLALFYLYFIPRQVSCLCQTVVPEVCKERISHVSKLVSLAFGDDATSSGKHTKDDRYESARNAALELMKAKEEKTHEQLVYGELSIPVLATILDAVGVEEGDRFLDIGSGDGALVLGTSLLYYAEVDDDGEGGKISRNAIHKSRGLEIVPGLYHRSLQHQKNLNHLLRKDATTVEDIVVQQQQQAKVEFFLGDIHNTPTNDSLRSIIQDTTLAICFATTWSGGNVEIGKKKTSLQGRRLDALSSAMSFLPKGARVVVVDGRLDEKDGHVWQGDLKVNCPDTAPYSIASLYIKKT
eukprot:scaffold14741_cov135-Cylindrotheca_fusiformis.AAC.10